MGKVKSSVRNRIEAMIDMESFIKSPPYDFLNPIVLPQKSAGRLLQRVYLDEKGEAVFGEVLTGTNDYSTIQ